MNGKLSLRGILFDLDGTILDTKNTYLEAAKTAFLATGQHPPSDAVALEIPKRLEQRLPLNDIVQASRQDFLNVYLKVFYAVSSIESKLIAGVLETLEMLSQKAKLSIITMRYAPSTVIVEELNHFGIAKYFTQVVTALDTHRPKPSPEALVKAVSAMAVQLCDCIIVGDSIIDIQAGEAAGVKSVAVLSGLYSQAELLKAKPHMILNDVTELQKLVK